MNVQGDYSIDAKFANDFFFFLIYENKTFNNKILGEKKKITIIWKANHNFLLIRTDFL